jgi:hypothetical protein
MVVHSSLWDPKGERSHEKTIEFHLDSDCADPCFVRMRPGNTDNPFCHTHSSTNVYASACTHLYTSFYIYG